MRSIGLVALAVIMASSSASAGDGCVGGGIVHHIFASADQNQDGRLTRAEYEDAGLQHFGVSFEESDANADCETSIAEYLELYERHHPPTRGTDV